MAIVCSPAFFGSYGWIWPGLHNDLVVKAAALPNTTISKSEFAPSRFAPCTEAQAAYPAANNPGIISYFPLTIFKHWVL